MGDLLVALVFTTVAGLSTAVGGLVVLLTGEPDYRKLGVMLSFSAGVMVYVSFVDILGEAFADVGFELANAAVCARRLTRSSLAGCSSSSRSSRRSRSRT